MLGTAFKIGDVVRLKSGGPSMTVELLISEHVLLCCWFHEGRRLNAIFRIEMLEATTRDRVSREGIQGVVN